MNLIKISCLVAAACLALQLQACSSSQAPTTQPPATGTTQNPGQNQTAPLDLTPELTVNQSIVIGKTTMGEMMKKYGTPKIRSTKSEFKTDIAKQGLNGPAIEELRAPFNVNPMTGEKSINTFPMYFTTDTKPVLVSTPILLNRGDLVQKAKAKTLTLGDIKNVYGIPTREAEDKLEYVDFDRKIHLIIKKSSGGSISARLTKYDLLYGKNQQDMKAYEQLVKTTPLAKPNPEATPKK